MFSRHRSLRTRTPANSPGETLFAKNVFLPGLFPARLPLESQAAVSAAAHLDSNRQGVPRDLGSPRAFTHKLPLNRPRDICF